MSFSLLRSRSRGVLCAALLFAAAAAHALDRRKPFAPTPQNVSAFWDGATRQLQMRLKTGQLLPLASPRVKTILETARRGQNLAFIGYLDEKYQRAPWLFMDLEPQNQVEVLERSAEAASSELERKALAVLGKAKLEAWELSKSDPGVDAPERNPAYLSEFVRARVQALSGTPPSSGSKAPAWHPVLARSKPALEKVSYDKKIAPPHKATFEESLRRRKSPWYDELKSIGVDLKSPTPPRLKVLGAQAQGSAGDLVFAVQWEQGKHHVGAFNAVVRQKDAEPVLSELAAPPAPLEDHLTLRFRQKMLAIFETAAEQKAAIGRFFEERKLRFLHSSWEGYYTAAVTGRVSAKDFARSVSGKGLVLYAAPKVPEVPGAKQVRLAFRNTLPAAAGSLAVSEDDVLKVLNSPGLSVIKKEPDGSYVVAATGNVSAARLADRMMARRAVLYAAPLASRAPESNQLILTVKPRPLSDEAAELAKWENQVTTLISGKGLRVLAKTGPHSFLIGPRGRPLSALVNRLNDDPIVESSIRVGSLPEERIDEAITGMQEASRGYRSTGSYFTESNIHTRQALLLAGATSAQLSRFDRAEQEASARGEFKN